MKMSVFREMYILLNKIQTILLKNSLKLFFSIGLKNKLSRNIDNQFSTTF